MAFLPLRSASKPFRGKTLSAHTGRFGRDGLLHDGSPDAQGAADLLCAFLHSLGDSPSEPGGIHAVPRPGLDGAAGSKLDHGAVGMPERLPLFAA